MEKLDVHKLFSQKQIEKRVEEVAAQIDKDYKDLNPIIAVVLKGGFIFASDLVRKMEIPFTLDFLGASSYVGTESSGDIKITKDLNTPIIDRHLILVEDIVDTGLTLFKLVKLLKQRDPKSVSISAMLVKDFERPFDLKVAYPGFWIPNKFVVGYGLDYNEQYRGLTYIGYVEPE